MTAENRVTAARAAREAAELAEEQAIRDAVAGGATPTEVAGWLGVRNRQRVYRILAAQAGEPARPVMPPVAYLRGAGAPPGLWHRAERAMWARGLVTTHDRAAAWKLCRAGVLVILADFSLSLDDNPPAPGGGHYHGYDRYVRVGLARARYGEDRREELVLVNGGNDHGPWGGTGDLDTEALARLAVAALDAGRGNAAIGSLA